MAWNEFGSDPTTFFKRGAVLERDLPTGAGVAHARQVLAEISARHEIFRTAFESVGGQPVRRVLPAYEHTVMEADAPVYPMMGASLTDVSPDDLARVWLTPSPTGNGKRLSIDINEMITDSWSCARMQGELAAIADGYGAAGSPDLPPPPAGYSAFAREQRSRELPTELVEYWLTTLRGLATPAYLEKDGPDPSGDGAGERVVVFTDEMTAGLRAICKKHHLTAFMAAVAVVKMALAARSGSRDILLSTTTSTRAGKWTDVQGNFSNVIPLRTVLPENPSFTEVLARTRTCVLGALGHQALPYLQLSRLLEGELPDPPVRVHYLPYRAHHYRILDSKHSGDAWIEDAVFAGHPLELGFAEDKHHRVAIWLSYDPTLYRHESVGKLLDGICEVFRLVGHDQDLTCTDLRQRIDFGG